MIIALLIPTLLLLFLMQFSFFMFAQRYKKGDLSDLGWTISVLLIVLACFFGSIDYNPVSRNFWILALPLLWFIRMAYLIFVKRVLSKGEDARYQHYRENWGSGGKYKFLAVFMVQPVFALILCLPFYYAFKSPVFTAWDYFGLVLFAIGFCGVFLSDYQLNKFKAGDQTGVCQKGLWNYSRHPNYFFEWVLWSSYPYFVFGLTQFTGELYQYSFWSVCWVLISPAFLLLLFLKVTGVPPSEQQALRKRGDAYRHYQKTTSVFVPLPKKSA